MVTAAYAVSVRALVTLNEQVETLHDRAAFPTAVCYAATGRGAWVRLASAAIVASAARMMYAANGRTNHQ